MINKNCSLFKSKDSPVLQTYKKPLLLKGISDLTQKFSTMRYFINRICFLNGKNDYLIYLNYPNIDAVDDYSKLLLFKIYKLYEIKKYKYFKIPNLDHIIIYNKNADLNQLIKFAFIISISNRCIYKNLNLTKDDMIIAGNIYLANEYKYEKNIGAVFNAFLRENILTNDFYSKLRENITREELESKLQLYFNNIKKNDKHFIKNNKIIFKKQFDDFCNKINKYTTTPEYKKFYNECKKSKLFKYDMKKYFGKEHTIQYQCFSNLIKEFLKKKPLTI